MAFAPAALRIRDFELTMLQVARLESSPYSRAQVAYDFMGEGWEAKLTLAHLTDLQAAEVEAWLASLKGPMVKFEAWLFRPVGPFGTIAVDPTVRVAAAARAEVVQVQQGHAVGSPSMVLNFAGNTNLGFTYASFAVGDRITIAGHLHVITAMDPVGGGGAQTITIWPRLRAPVVVDEVISAARPYGTWRLATGRNGWARPLRGVRTQTIDLIEAL
jgi:hypothetical protein